MMMSNNRDNISHLIEFVIQDKQRSKLPDINESIVKCKEIPMEEEKIIDNFLSRYMILHKNQENNTINLQLVVKAFPKLFTKQSIALLEQLHFQKMQNILISFFNDD